MRAVLPLFFFVLGTLTAYAQPANDNCTGAVSLSLSATCGTNVFTNIGATTSNIGTNNSPSCFNGGTTQRDVWFSFTTPADTRQVTITVKGVGNGSNTKAIVNPQIAIYRGTCTGLSQIGCVSAANGSSEVRLDATMLTPNVTYFLRVNDYAATATPNAGDFNICVQPFIPSINMGTASSTTSCFGTLYDSGGPNGNYSILEDYTFTICPSEPHSCIEINLEDYDIEPTILGFFGDALTFYAGVTTSAPVISRVEGQDIGTNFRIQASSQCLTVRFQSDFLSNYRGFKLTWQCSATACQNRSFSNPTPVSSLPFSDTGVSTCESASTIANSPCASDDFLNGPEYVYAYNAPGNTCVSVDVTGAAAETGVVILDGLPGAAGTNCVARSATGKINSANLLVAGTYYIVVANGRGCTPFNINIQETTCAISPALVNALCNPLNGCVRLDGLPTVFDFEDGFQDMQIEEDVNNGCWLGFGVEPNFYWFTIQSQADGRFGFILNSANPDTLSDLDYNVWGPFTQDQVCGNPQQVITFIRNNQPIRSSWSPTSGPTGLTDTHPTEGYRITDRYDCGNGPEDAGADGDDFVSTILTKKGEVYVVLINDWENLIGDQGVAIDWSPSDPPVLEQLPAEVVAGDTAVCLGDSVRILIESPVNSITWLNDTETLSCNNCPNPVARPLRTTEYRALVNAVCYNDTISVTVRVFDLDAGPDVTVCRGEKFDLIVGEVYENATYNWTVPANIELSCTNCPNPTVTAPTAGSYRLIATLTAPGCTLRDTVNITVRAETAPVFTIRDDIAICEGTTVDLGGPATDGVVYSWTSNPAGFTSTQANPRVTPTQTTTYILRATNATCPLASLDSVTVTVFAKPIIEVAADTAVCQESPIQLGNTTVEADVIYEWTGPDVIENPANANSLAFPTSTGAYVLTASRGNGVCIVTDTVDVQITPIDIDIQLEDTVQVCRGVPLQTNFNVVPTGTPVVIASTDGLFRDTVQNTITLLPDRATTYIASVTSQGCVRFDTLTVLVDSLPSNLAIMPGDTTVCQGSLVLLTSEIFEPKDFPNIEFEWLPRNGQQTPDSLYNMVIQADTTTRYYRVSTSGVCVDTAFANVTVNPIPIVEIMPSDTTVCIGERVKFTVKTTPGDVEKPMWEPATGLSCVECLEPTATVLSTTTYTLKVEYQGCPGSGSARVKAPIPDFKLTNKTQICQGDTVKLNSIANPDVTYTWTSPNDPNFRNNDPFLVVRPDRTTTYRLVAQVPGCTPVEGQITITVISPPNLNATADPATVCRGGSVKLVATSNVPNNTFQTFTWQGNNTTFTGAEVNIPNLQNTTDFILTYTYGVNNLNLCGTLRDTVRVNVIEAGNIQIIPSDTTICEGQPVRFNIVASGEVRNPSWTGEALSANNILNPIATPISDIALYVIRAEVGNCPGTLSDTAIIRTIPLPALALRRDTICQGETIELNQEFTPGAIYNWTSPNDPNFRSNSPIPVVSPTQTTTYRVSATNRGCGPVTGEITIPVTIPIPITIEGPESICNERPLVLSARRNPLPGIPESFSWNVGGTTFTGEQVSIEKIEARDSIVVTLVYNYGGCTSIVSKVIKVQNCSIQVPNAFTPNGDNKNDFFNYVGDGTETLIEFKVFNRWGQVVYNNTNPTQGWDGRHNGRDAPSDVYVYIIRVRYIDGTEELKRGNVTLIR
ncbi:MAG: gliding motility-associated C-terminal domain-containing protein [Saprospiraceae bacterium]